MMIIFPLVQLEHLQYVHDYTTYVYNFPTLYNPSHVAGMRSIETIKHGLLVG